MNVQPDLVQTLVVAWVVTVTIFLAILLPFTLNVQPLPAVFFRLAGPDLEENPAMTEAPPVADTPDKLLLSYDFEDNFIRSHRVTDRTRNRNDGVTQGVFIGEAPGIAGNRSISLPGTGYVWAPRNPAAGRTSVTFSLWFTAGDRAHNYNLAASVASGPRSGWIIGTHKAELWDDSGEPILRNAVYGAGGQLVFAPWNHKAVVYDGADVKEYLNGRLVSVYNATGRPVGAGKEMTIGSWQPFGQNYAGQIDEFRIYDRALSEENVTALYRQRA